MPLKLHVGLSKKIGLPNYGSLGASCHLEVELDSQVITRDRNEFKQQLHQAFEVCSQAVDDQLTHRVPASREAVVKASRAENPRGPESTGASQNGASEAVSPAGTNGRAPAGQPRPNLRLATSPQVRAIIAIANRQDVNLVELLQNRFGVDDPSALTVSDASQLIDELRAMSAAGADSA